MRRFFKNCRADNNPHSWELYREAQRRYRKEVRKVSKETWRTFCSSVNDLPRSAKLHRDLSRDHKIRPGYLVAPSVGRTKSEAEILYILLATHFPNSTVTERGAVLAAACRAKRLDWRMAARIVTYRRVGSHIKFQVWMGNSRLCCKSDGRSLPLTWSRFFVPAWGLDMLQAYGARLK